MSSARSRFFKKEDKKVLFGEMFTRIISNGGIQDWDKIIIDTKDDIDGKLQEDQMKLQQIIQQMVMQPSQVPPTLAASHDS